MRRAISGLAFYLLAIITGTGFLLAQTEDTGWHLMDPTMDGVNGTSVETLYSKLKDKSSQTIVVAIIDSGVDIDHEDLRDNIWVNEDEIPDNGVDDDGNGYVDDVHGWNFLGNADGTNITSETLEVTRLYALYRDRFEDVDINDLNKKERELYTDYQEYKQTVKKEMAKAKSAISNFDANEKMLLDAIDAFRKKYPNKKLTEKFMREFEGGSDPQMSVMQQIFEQVGQFGIEVEDIDTIEQEIRVGYKEAKKDFAAKVDYWYNPDFDSREIIGDDYDDPKDIDYGNPDVKATDNFHGTHVAGIVGAVRGNDIGVKGIATDVRLMVLRAVPDGDEHDKDVANAIRYAVDNGASVVNMSFGKYYGRNKVAVDKAVKHAMKNDVLLVHAAGNEAFDNDVKEHFPVPEFEKRGLFGKKEADNWIEVGAVNRDPGEGAIASFSNYGAETVDLFAPGGMINSTAPDNSYRPASGTSMASPVVAGVAALLRSYYPTLTAAQVKSILVESTDKVEGKVRKPGSREVVPMSELCISGGMINAKKAFELAEQTKGKKKKSQVSNNSASPIQA